MGFPDHWRPQGTASGLSQARGGSATSPWSPPTLSLCSDHKMLTVATLTQSTYGKQARFRAPVCVHFFLRLLQQRSDTRAIIPFSGVKTGSTTGQRLRQFSHPIGLISWVPPTACRGLAPGTEWERRAMAARRCSGVSWSLFPVSWTREPAGRWQRAAPARLALQVLWGGPAGVLPAGTPRRPGRGCACRCPVVAVPHLPVSSPQRCLHSQSPGGISLHELEPALPY